MLFDKFKQVKAFVFGVDGVLTDSSVSVAASSGERLFTFNTKDEYVIQLAVKKAYPVAIIAGNGALGVKKQLEGLGVKDVYIGVDDKRTVLSDWLSHRGLDSKDILYMGDDIPDLDIMKIVGFPTCPADAVEEIKAVAAYISFRNGGAGAVRDVIEMVMKLQGIW